MSEQHDELEDKYKDLCDKNMQLIDWCKAKDKDLQDNEQEIVHLRAQLAHYTESQLWDLYDKLPAKRVKGMERALTTAPLPHPSPWRKQGDINSSRPATISTVWQCWGQFVQGNE
jgi:hypothetical protein